jgi:SAM-dependent methyltransferase
MPTVPPARTPFGGRESHQAREIAESFGSDADRYDRARPRYPGALVDRIVADARRSQPSPDVLDVGCGTGIVARQFQAAGCRVLGVDPDARMADLARRHGRRRRRGGRPLHGALHHGALHHGGGHRGANRRRAS